MLKNSEKLEIESLIFGKLGIFDKFEKKSQNLGKFELGITVIRISNHPKLSIGIKSSNTGNSELRPYIRSIDFGKLKSLKLVKFGMTLYGIIFYFLIHYFFTSAIALHYATQFKN